MSCGHFTNPFNVTYLLEINKIKTDKQIIATNEFFDKQKITTKKQKPQLLLVFKEFLLFISLFTQ